MPDEIVSIGTTDNKKYLLDMRDVTSRFDIPKHFGAERFLVELGPNPEILIYQGSFPEHRKYTKSIELPVHGARMGYTERGPICCKGDIVMKSTENITQLKIIDGKDRDEAIRTLDGLYKEAFLEISNQ